MEEIKKRFDEYFKGNIDENSYLHINTVYVRYFIQSEIDLAVSKERERIVEKIKLETDAWLRTELLWLQSTLHKKVFITDEIKMEYVDSAIEDILKLINTK